MSDLMEWTYVIVGPQGVYWLGHARDEDHAWNIAWGWPDALEVEDAIRRGWYAARATVTWNKPGTERTTEVEP